MCAKRVLNLAVINTDRFLDLHPIEQALYYQLMAEADDVGIIASPKKVIKFTEATGENLGSLVDSGFLLKLNEGLYVITDWHLHNSVRWDRYKGTIYQVEIKDLRIHDKSKKYNFETGKKLSDLIKLGEQKKIERNRANNRGSNLLLDLTDEESVENDGQMSDKCPANAGKCLANAGKCPANADKSTPIYNIKYDNIEESSLGQSIACMTENQFLKLINMIPGLENVDGRLYSELKSFLIDNRKEDLNVSEYVKYIVERMKYYKPLNFGSYFYHCILDIDSIKRFETIVNSSEKTEINYSNEDLKVECPACKNLINQYDDCSFCNISRSSMKDPGMIELYRKRFNMPVDLKKSYLEEEDAIYKKFSWKDVEKIEKAKEELNRKYNLI